MTHEEKIAYLDIACRIANIGIEKKALDLIVSLYDLVLQKEGKSNIEDVVTVKHIVDTRYIVEKKTETFISCQKIVNEMPFPSNGRNAFNRYFEDRNLHEMDALLVKEHELKRIRGFGKPSLQQFKYNLERVKNAN